MSDSEVIEKALNRKKKSHLIPKKDMVSSGSTLLNMAVSGRSNGCFAKGHYYWFVGDSASGKSWLALSIFAEASINKNFNNYRLIYDDAENGALMNIEKFFGPRVGARIEPPNGDRENPEYSELVEDLYYNLDDALNDGRPFIYVCDSMDALEAREDKDKFKEMKSVRQGRSKKKVAGNYGMSKAKTNSSLIRGVVSRLRKAQAIVIIISQTRDNAGFGAQFNPQTAAGGRALKFYATVELWTKIKTKIKKTVRKKLRTIGIISQIKVKKNRVTGRDRTVEVPIYYSHGIDDVGSCVDYLIEEGHWKSTGKEIKTVTAPEFDFNGLKEDLIQKIETEDLQVDLRNLVKEVWDEIEEACEVQRKSRYD